VRTHLKTQQKVLHPLDLQELPAVGGRLVRDVPHGGPRHLQHVVAVAPLQPVGDQPDHLLQETRSPRLSQQKRLSYVDGSQLAQLDLLLAVHLARQRVQQVDPYPLDEALLLHPVHRVQQDVDQPLVIEQLQQHA
jgi:hypothetical protein